MIDHQERFRDDARALLRALLEMHRRAETGVDDPIQNGLEQCKRLIEAFRVVHNRAVDDIVRSLKLNGIAEWVVAHVTLHHAEHVPYAGGAWPGTPLPKPSELQKALLAACRATWAWMSATRGAGSHGPADLEYAAVNAVRDALRAAGAL